jgi:hypothetical protein
MHSTVGVSIIGTAASCVAANAPPPFNLAPDSRPPPPNNALVASSDGPKSFGHIVPGGSGPQDPKYAVEDTPVVHAGRGKLTANEPAAISPEAGHGPRHMPFSPNNKCLYTCSTSSRDTSRNMQSILARAR